MSEQISMPISVDADDVAKAAGFVETAPGVWRRSEAVEFAEKYGESYVHNSPDCKARWIQKGKAAFCPGCGERLGSGFFCASI